MRVNAIMSVLISLFFIGGATAAVNVEKITYSHYGNCLKLSNGEVEVVVTTDIGPRVIAYSFVGGENILAEMDESSVVKTEFGEWHPWGGHRLWSAPEAMPRSYSPDNNPVKYEISGNSVKLMQPVEPGTGIEKQMIVTLDDSGTKVTVDHKLINKNHWDIELSPWCLTIMSGGGQTIFPQEPYMSHSEKLLPARPLVLWHYTDMSDARWHWGRKFCFLKCDPKMQAPQKVGAAVNAGWVGYQKASTLFIKRFPFVKDAHYPDYGVNFETYTAGSFMEVETLGPLTKLAPNGAADYIEKWFLFKGVDICETEECVEKNVMPLVEKTSF